MTVASTVMFMRRGEISRQAWSLAGTSPEGEGMAVLKKGARITGTERNKLANDLRKQYDKGRSIRELAESHGRSYGFVHRVLTESGATLRGRGGATRAKKKGK
jgi:helix-turn-helix protein